MMSVLVRLAKALGIASVYATTLSLFLTVCTGNEDAKRLYDDLLCRGGYNKLIRPVSNNSDKLTVRLGIRLSQLIDVVSTVPYSPSLSLSLSFSTPL